MIDTLELAKQAGIEMDDELEPNVVWYIDTTSLERLLSLHRTAVIEELSKGAGEPVGTVAINYEVARAVLRKKVQEGEELFTREQVAQAVAKDRGDANLQTYKAAIKSVRGLNERITALEAANRELLDAVVRFRRWAEADKVNYTGDHPIAQARALIAKHGGAS